MTRFAAPADARVFLGRLTHLDPGAVVRLRPSGTARTALWARLPWGVLVTREVVAAPPGDATVGAADLLSAGERLPSRRDREWRWPLPPRPDAVVEEIPAGRLREVAAAAAGTLREVTETGLAGRPVGSRVLREALLDHVAVVVEAGAARLEVSQRLVQAVVRMGFLGPTAAGSGAEAGPGAGGGSGPGRDADSGPGAGGGSGSGADVDLVRVQRAGRWVGLAARYGTAWLPPAAGPLSLRPSRSG